MINHHHTVRRIDTVNGGQIALVRRERTIELDTKGPTLQLDARQVVALVSALMEFAEDLPINPNPPAHIVPVTSPGEIAYLAFTTRDCVPAKNPGCGWGQLTKRQRENWEAIARSDS